RRNRSALLGQRQDGGDPRRLGGAHRARIMTEVALRRGIDAIGTDARLGIVEIDLHDPALAPHMLDQESEPGLDAFARIAAAVPQEGGLGGLLANGGPATDTAARGVALGRILDRLEVEPVVPAELAVLG